MKNLKTISEEYIRIKKIYMDKCERHSYLISKFKANLASNGRENGIINRKAMSVEIDSINRDIYKIRGIMYGLKFAFDAMYECSSKTISILNNDNEKLATYVDGKITNTNCSVFEIGEISKEDLDYKCFVYNLTCKYETSKVSIEDYVC
ncbi:MAG: hypothetical protein ACRC7S_05700 [Cetobacterium sp.]